MKKARLDGLYLLLLGSLVFLLLGTALERTFSVPMVDFKPVYFAARCLIQNRDPYMESELLRISQTEGASGTPETAKVREVTTWSIYLPTSFAITVPIALLPWGPAHTVWLLLILGSMLVASSLIWNIGADCAPIVCGVMIGFFLANSEVILVLGNAAGIAVGLCVIAVCCLVCERCVAAGIFCLAVSLVLKPQDAGLVWLYFLLAGGVYRKRALQSLLITAALCLPVVLWVWHVAPHWFAEWQSNISAFSARGGNNDPGPASTGGHGLGMLVNLQAVISLIRDDPRIYNPVSYAICAPLLTIWVIVTLRYRGTRANAWLGLAPIAALTMLPVYHHLYDAKLLLLTVPACAMLWAGRGVIGWLALLLNAAGFVLTGDLPWAGFLFLIHKLRLPTTGLSGELLTGLQVLPAPLILLAMGTFYLWVYARQSPNLDIERGRV